MAQVDYFLKIAGVDGESTDDKHKGEIDLESFSWGETNSPAPPAMAAARGAGKVQPQDFHFVKKLDKASPVLFVGVRDRRALQVRDPDGPQGRRRPAGVSRRSRLEDVPGELLPVGRLGAGRRRADRPGQLELRQARDELQGAEARRQLGGEVKQKYDFCGQQEDLSDRHVSARAVLRDSYCRRRRRCSDVGSWPSPTCS